MNPKLKRALEKLDAPETNSIHLLCPHCFTTKENIPRIGDDVKDAAIIEVACATCRSKDESKTTQRYLDLKGNEIQ